MDTKTQDIFRRVINGDAAILYQAFKNGMPLHSLKDTAGNTLLMVSAQYGKVPALKYLLKVPGLHINEVNEAGDTALNLTAIQAQTLAACYLLDAGADWNIANQKGRTPLQTAHHFQSIDKYNKFSTYILLLEQGVLTDAPKRIVETRSDPLNAPSMSEIIKQSALCRVRS